MIKRCLPALFIITVITCAVYSVFNGPIILFPFLRGMHRIECARNLVHSDPINVARKLLKIRKDKEALAVFERIAVKNPQDLDAAWGKAEIIRRGDNNNQAEEMLREVLSKDPNHIPTLLSLSLIRYQANQLSEALNFAKRVLDQDCDDKDNLAMAYVMLGCINGKRAQNGGFFQKIKYGPQVKGYFLKARELAPDLSEAHLALGTFYLLAPKMIGGNLNGAIKELELAVSMAQDFATANIRLAQAYNKKGDLKKYDFYLKRAKKLDPKIELLKEEL